MHPVNQHDYYGQEAFSATFSWRIRAILGESAWKEIEDTQRITWEYFRSIKDAQAYIKKLGPWRIE
jgi:hypothetical protein